MKRSATRESTAKSMYLDWVNNFLTVERFAEYYGLTVDEANEVINEGRQLHNKATEYRCKGLCGDTFQSREELVNHACFTAK